MGNNLSRTQEFNKSKRRFPQDDWHKRCKRIGRNVKTLYHVTDLDAAQNIIKSGRMLRGRGGLGGAGIYFATSVDDAKRKAQASGVLITCKVKLGNVKTVSSSGHKGGSFSELFNEGFDSVLIPRTLGDEYVVYNCDQAVISQVLDLNTGEILYTAPEHSANLPKIFFFLFFAYLLSRLL